MCVICVDEYLQVRVDACGCGFHSHVWVPVCICWCGFYSHVCVGGSMCGWVHIYCYIHILHAYEFRWIPTCWVRLCVREDKHACVQVWVDTLVCDCVGGGGGSSIGRYAHCQTQQILLDGFLKHYLKHRGYTDVNETSICKPCIQTLQLKQTPTKLFKKSISTTFYSWYCLS